MNRHVHDAVRGMRALTTFPRKLVKLDFNQQRPDLEVIEIMLKVI